MSDDCKTAEDRDSLVTFCYRLKNIMIVKNGIELFDKLIYDSSYKSFNNKAIRTVVF